MSQTLLVIEDDPRIQETLKFLLTDGGYKVLSSYTGRNAMDLIEAHSPDLVLMDIKLGTLDGRDICRGIKESAYAKTPVILMSGQLSAEDAINQSGADAFIPKPFNIDLIIDKIKETMQLKNLAHPN
ncbi:MAG: response regulator [Daejeonella sp.]|nr:response regulator [Daejeonella sp.]